MRLPLVAAAVIVCLLFTPPADAAVGDLQIVANTGSPDLGEIANVDLRPAVSADGRFVAYLSRHEYANPLFLRDVLLGTSTTVAWNRGRDIEGGENSAPVLSADGRYLAFASDETDLSPEDIDRHRTLTGVFTVTDVFLYDRLSEKVRLVSRRSGPEGKPANGGSVRPSISEDGQVVAFKTGSSNLAPPGPFRLGGIFVRDQRAQRTHLVWSVPGIQFWHPNTYSPDISGDGSRVAFESDYSADPYRPGHPPRNISKWIEARTRQVMLWEPGRPTPRLVSRADGADGEVANGHCLRASVSRTGRFIAFDCLGTNLVSGDANGVRDVFVRDVEIGRTLFVSGPGSVPIGDGESDAPSISADGRFVAFQSYADNLVPDDPDKVSDVFLKDLQTGALTLLSPGIAGQPSNGASANPVITPDARFVVYASTSSNIAGADPSDDLSIYRVQTNP